MNGQVIWKGEVYLISPVVQAGEVYYLVYKKMDSGKEKEAFESVNK